MVCALACLGVLTTIRSKRFYRNFILINKTLLLAHLFIHVCFSTIMLAKAKKQEHRYISIFLFFCFVFCCIIQTKHSGKQNHRSLPESVLKSLMSQHCECICHHAVLSLLLPGIMRHLFDYTKLITK